MKKSLKKRVRERLYRVYKHAKSKIVVTANIKIYLYLLYYSLVTD